MTNHIIDVPSDLKYISEWEGYQIPEGKCIIDKKVCGCGYTEFCIHNSDNIILCSPRIALLENKSEQNPHCHYFQSITLSPRQKRDLGLDSDQKISEYILNLQKSQVFNYLQECKTIGIPPKFLVTYDSLGKFIGILQYFQVDLSYYKVIVDEFQLIFSDARFKADVELDFIKILDQSCSNVCFLSSTPMLQRYLEMIPEFQGLDYYEFCWGKHQIITPSITKIDSTNLEQSIIEIIGLYKEGKGPTKIVNGVEYQSKEAVFYVSNVSMITSVIKKLKLSPSEVNIICSKLESTLEKIRKCGKGFKAGKAPLKGEPHKMFTFCTSTAFAGVDFYSTCAKSYVFSDCNLNTMNIDISIELPQIIGRQRLSENVFRYDVVFYSQSNIKKISEEEFKENVKQKKIHTQEIIDDFKALISVGRDVDRLRKLIRAGIKQYKYSEDYCGIDKLSGVPVYNNLVYLSELRAWELQNKIYEDDLSVLMVLDKIGDTTTTTKFLDEIVSIPYFDLRMEKMVEYLKNHPEDINKLPDKYRVYFDNISLSELEKSSLRKDALDKRLTTIHKNKTKEDPEIITEVYKLFDEGKVYLKSEIKNLLSGLYLSRSFKAKATDIKLYFETTRSRITNKLTGQRDEGYKLIRKKY